ncbi:MAG: hypothetical protein BroJett018_17030 [Chloroflexota bacterium]|nr:hypothetical protein [Chloroflexota bacterium]NOG66099.1 hypothetical protein [Chloroflexota bacterium]GIK63909.1 MAG: hypothetical protein BroJett018_17030 [Chloroflexota bacterium]
MKKIVSLFKRDYEGTRLVYDEVVEGAEWVIAGEGTPTPKWDGTSCLIQDGVLYKRYDAKKGKNPPEGFVPAQDPDPITGHWPGWLAVDGNKPDDKWHWEAWNHLLATTPPDELEGTYELIGPKVQGNPYKLDRHQLVRHGDPLFVVWETEPPRDFEGLKLWLGEHKIEGIVWHHPDGRMVKIKRRDFGYKWPE